MVRESRHLWVGNLPENVHEEQIADYFKRYGRVEKVKLLPKQSADGGKAAFVDFVDIRAATKANEAANRMGERELRTNYNEPGNPGVMNERGKPNDRRQISGYDRGSDEFGRDRPKGYAADEGAPPRQRFRYRETGKQGAKSTKQKFPRVTPDSSDSGKSGSDSSDDGDSSQSDSGDSNSDSDSDDDAPKKPVKAAALCVKNLSTRTSDHSLQEALFHEFKKVGDIIYIRVFGSGEQRYAVVKFRNGADAEKAMVSSGKMFLGQEMKLLPWKLDEKDDDRVSPSPKTKSKLKHYGNAVEELGYDPQATRTLFVGNLEKTLTHGELKRAFDKFGDIVDVDIKKQDRGVTTYAFIQFIDVGGAMRGKKRMDRQFVGRNRVKVGYGRGTPTNTIWVGNLSSNVSESQLQRQFNVFGIITKILIDQEFFQSLIWFETIDSATVAFTQTRGKFIHGKRLTVDFASRSCKEGFYSRMEQSGQLDRRDIEPSPPPRPSYGNSGAGGRTSYNRRGSNGPSNYDQRGGRGSYSSRFSRGGSPDREYNNGPSDPYFGGGSGNGGYGNVGPDDDYDDYERELRDYGYRQKERERERGRKPERGMRDNPDRGYSPLSDEEQQQRAPMRSSRDSRSPLSGRNEEGSYVSDREMRFNSSRRLGIKRKHADDDPYLGGSPSPSRVESVVTKVDRVKKKKKDKLLKRRARVSIDAEAEFGGSNNEEIDDETLLAQERLAKLERIKRKRKMSLEKAEERARRKELKRLRRLKKLRLSEGLAAEQGTDKAVMSDSKEESLAVVVGDGNASDVALTDKLELEQEKSADLADPDDGDEFPIGKEEPIEKDDREANNTATSQDATAEDEAPEDRRVRSPIDTPASPTFDGEMRRKEGGSVSPVPADDALEITVSDRSPLGPSSPAAPGEPRTPPTPNLEEDDEKWRDDDESSTRKRATQRDHDDQYQNEDDAAFDDDRSSFYNRQRREKGPKTPPPSDDASRALSPSRVMPRDRRPNNKENFSSKYDSAKKREDSSGSGFRETRDGSRENRASAYGRGGSEYRDEWRERPSRDPAKRDRGFDRYENKPRERDERPPVRDRMRFRRSPSPRAGDQRQRSPPMRYRDQMDKRPRSPPSSYKQGHSPEFMRSRGDSPERARSYDKRLRGRPPSPFGMDKDRDTRLKSYGHHSQTRGDGTDMHDRRDYGRGRHERGPGGREDSPPPPPPPPPSKHDAHSSSSTSAVPTISSHHKQQQPSSAIPYQMSSGPAQPSSGGAVSSPSNAYTLLDLLRRYPVMWQGIFALKHNSAAIQMHYLSGNVRIAELSLPHSSKPGEVPPPLTISQRMKLEPSQLDGVNKRIETPKDHCLLLALPCGRDPLDVHAQTRALKSGFISYLQEKQAAGIININSPTTKQPAYVLHIFPPCDFAQSHLAKVAPDLLDSAADSGHLMVLVTTI